MINQKEVGTEWHVHRMTTQKFVSSTVRGLNIPMKIYNILRELKHLQAEVVLLQETHISQESNLKILSKDYPLWFYGDSLSKRAKGVAIGFARGVRFSLEERVADPEGRYLLLRGRIYKAEYSIDMVQTKKQ